MSLSDDDPVPPPELPPIKVDFFAEMQLLALFFSQVLACPNLIEQSFVIEVAEGKISVLDMQPGGGDKTTKHYYLRVKAAIGGPKYLESGEPDPTGEIVAMPIQASFTTPIPIPFNAGKVLAAPIRPLVAMFAQARKAEDLPTHIRITFAPDTNPKSPKGTMSMNFRRCNERGGLIEIARPGR